MDAEIITIIVSAIGLVITTIASTIQSIKAKVQGSANSTLQAENSTLQAENSTLQKVVSTAQVCQKLPQIINDVEQSFPTIDGVKFGAMKKRLVMQEVKNECAERDIDFDEKGFSQEIENILSTPQTKEVSSGETTSNA